MDAAEHRDASAPRTGGGRHRPWGTALAMIAAIVAFYLVREHWNHLAGLWLYLLLLACPLMHLFHGHGGHGRHGARFERERKG
mgnify:CR=1 FL=1